MKIFPKKSLGQNFLKSEGALNTIIEAGEINQGDFVLEIGPGRGALTEKLLESGAKKILAIEKDRDLIKILEEKFFTQIKNGKIEIIEQDILEFEPNLEKREYKVIANIPYYITGAIIRKFLSTQNQPKKMVLLIQKEVAERIIARNKKESLLSISVKAYCEPRIEKNVSAGSFVPAPKVDSAIISFQNISKKIFSENNLSEETFFKIIHIAFSHKRKTLRKNLEILFEKETIDKKLQEMTLDPKIRAEDLSIDDWVKLIKSLEKHSYQHQA